MFARPPLALEAFVHERHLPQVKHVGEIAKFRFRRTAQEHGYDDAAFVDHRGRLSEASIWNLAFWDGKVVIWPEANLLPGVTLQILQRQLTAIGISQIEREMRLTKLTDELAGVVMNSWTPGVPISRIGSSPLRDGSDFTELLQRTYQAETPIAP